MLFFREVKATVQQKTYLKQEIYYKLYKLFVIFFKSPNALGLLRIQLKKNSFYKNICIFSKKSKSIIKLFKVSRAMLREKSNVGFFFGLNKLSW